MEAERLKNILDFHKKWLDGDPDGVRADLRGVDFRNANLSGADLRGADLREASLYGADLRNANLRGANLHGANLHKSDSRGTNLHKADLRETKGLDQFIFARALGSRNDETQWDMKNDILLCGCFRGTLAEFAARVEEVYKNNPVHLAEYRAMIKFFREVQAARGYAKAA